MSERNDKARVAKLEKALRALGTEERAAAEKKYLKSELDHFGVPVPVIRRVVRDALRAEPELDRKTLIGWAETLYARDVHELRMAAVELLVARTDLLAVKDLALVEQLIRRSYTWALVDPLAVVVASAVLSRASNATKTLDRWAKDQDLWIRRAALLAHLRPLHRGEGDLDRFFRYADLMLEEKEFFIRKAIGWVLRETAKKRPNEVYEWLAPRIDHASATTVREAVKHLPKRSKDRLLTKYARRSQHHGIRQR